MNKYLLLLVTSFSIQFSQAQNTSDALRYAQDNLNGTARFRGMSGAFGALGGDFSALSVNPAGSAVFLNNQAAVTLSNFSRKNESNYFGTESKEKENSFDLNQIGAVWVFDSRDETSNWRKFTVAVNYENTNNFDDKLFSNGNNPTNSISQYFLSYANGPRFNNTFENDQVFIGTTANIIATNPEANGNPYISSVPAGGNYYQENSVTSRGYNGKMSFNFATQYKDRFYFGVNLNAHFTDYATKSSFYEDYLDTPGSSSSAGLQASRFNNELYTYGSGFSFQLGAIAKVTDNLRLGASYESPTWYQLQDETYQIMVVDCADCGFSGGQNVIEPSTFNLIYDTYRLQTPGKYTGSLAYVFGTAGLISIDYSMKDYSNTKFRPNDSFFNSRNQEMESLLGTTSEIRVGAEARARQWSFRGGYRFEQSPYKNGNVIGDLHGISGGLGYNFGRTRVDAAYSYAQRDTQRTFFSQGLTDAADIKSVFNNVSLTLVFDL